MSINLATNKKIEISAFVSTPQSLSCEEKYAHLLTDGNTGSINDRFGTAWASFQYGLGRTLFVDLGGVFAVSGFDISFLHDPANNAACPENVRLLLSENGFDYYCALTVDAPYPSSFAMCARASYKGTLEHPVRARYVKVIFAVEENAFCDELRILGNECNGYESILSGKKYIINDKNVYASRDCLGGVCDLPMLSFGSDHRISREEFLPYLAYIDHSGRISDRMFDAVALIHTQYAPSGNSLYQDGEPSVMSDWEWLIDELFTSESNLSALDSAVADVKSVLGLSKDYRHKVFLTAPVPKISLKPFGSINGDGITSKLVTTDDCVRAFCRFVDVVVRRFNAQCFQNITIEGWLWNSSLSRKYNEKEADFAQKCVDELHARNFKCVFAPSDRDAGIFKSENVGFDCVTVKSVSEDLALTFATSKKYGFGIRLDTSDYDSEPSVEQIKQYENCLRECMRNGVMTQTIHAYHLPLYRCICSSDASVRAVYDKIYRFVKGRLSEMDFEQQYTSAPSDEHRADVDAPRTLPDMSEEIPIPDLPEAVDTDVTQDADEEFYDENTLEVSEELLDEIIGFIPDVADQADDEWGDTESFDQAERIINDAPFEASWDDSGEEISLEHSESDDEVPKVPSTSVSNDLAVEVAVSVEIKTPDTTVKAPETVVAETVCANAHETEAEHEAEEKIIPPKTSKAQSKSCKKTHLAYALGAAAVLGIAYIIKKLSNDK